MDSAPLMLSVSGARGIVGQSMTPEVAVAFGLAFGSWLRDHVEGTPRVITGRDGRHSGAALLESAIAGLASTGCRVTDLGVAMTPTVGVMVLHDKADGALISTASHNPIEWNGFKCLDASGAAPPAAQANAIIERFKAMGRAPAVSAPATPVARRHDADEIHVQRVLKLIDRDAIRAAKLSVVVDSVNGAGCHAVRVLLKALGVHLEHLNGEVTGQFAHTPEPIEANLRQLAGAVAKGGFACGFAQDPDADRLAIVDERGRFIGEEYTLALCALRVLERGGPGAMATNLSTSRMIDSVAAMFPGSRVLRSAVGEANVVSAMKAAHCVVGGEGNGGVIWPSVCWIRDSLSGIALTLELLAKRGTPLSTIVSEIPAVSMIKRKLELAGIGGIAAVRPALERVTKSFAKAKLDTTDGVRIDLPEGWVHLRASNTEPIIRLIAEAGSVKAANDLADEVAASAGLPS
ncbi:MAG: phosphoglucosamine mutase [Planctomycetes bacterium]|nr:phosphoglucosamine mutase [Planctomycetota bacterium]